MKIGVIGLGNIAQKAYLPVLGVRADIELVLATRNESVLNTLGRKYKTGHLLTDLDDLIASGVEAVFVNAATVAHFKIVERLLENKIHVYVDKPVAYHLHEVKHLVKLAEKNKRNLMVGFNRRFVPMYQELKETKNKNFILMEKNRTFTPGSIREVVFDDFIHVVDTIRYLGDFKENFDFEIDYILEDNFLKRIMLTLRQQGRVAIGIMNRDSGITEEQVEVMGFKEKKIVRELTEIEYYKDDQISKKRAEAWQPMLYNRGFHNIISNFIELARDNKIKGQISEDAFETHRICEMIVNQIAKTS